jgi:hypothetical protein
MEQSHPWEANSHSASQEVSRFSRNPKVHYRVQKCLPLDPILGYLISVNILTPYFFKIHFNIILPSVPKSAK